MTTESTEPQPEHIQSLLRYLPIFSAPDFVPTIPNTDPENYYPNYRPEVEAFYTEVSDSALMKKDYVPAEVAEYIDDDSVIATADIEKIRALLTYCVRGERFCTGYWGKMIREGRITAILRRLGELYE